jgi:hypothetical protein
VCGLLLLAAEQERIQREREDARKWARAADQDGEEVVRALDEALRLLEIGPSLYATATPNVRRLLNNALFAALFVVDDEVASAESVEWVGAIERLGRSIDGPRAARRRRAPSVGRGLDKDKLVRRVGFEPTHPFGQGLLRAPRLPFRHRRMCDRV